MLSRVIISTIKTVSKLLAIHIALIWEMANKLNEGEGLELRSTDNPGGPKGSLKPFKKLERVGPPTLSGDSTMLGTQINFLRQNIFK